MRDSLISSLLLSSTSPRTSTEFIPQQVELSAKEREQLKQGRDLFVDLNSSDTHDLADLLTITHVGGKALRLAEMMQAQREHSNQNTIDVPPAGCVTTFGYDTHIEVAQLNERIRELMRGGEEHAISKELASIRQCILDTPIAQLVRTRVDVFLRSLPDHVKSLAVRSSSTMEDLHGSSYAGQYDTYLNVPRDTDAVCDAVKRCWASMWQEHILAYRKQLKLNTEDPSSPAAMPSMAVVVQKQLNPQAAGVLFTLNPLTGAQDQMVVEACFGLGEGVVCGELSPHSFVVDWVHRKLVSSSTPSQKRKFAFRERIDEKGEYIHLVDTSSVERSTAALSEQQVLQLVTLGLEVACHYEHPQDLEWALEDGQLYLLQARPITAFKVDLPERYSYAAFFPTSLLSLSLSAQSYADMMARCLDPDAQLSSVRGQPDPATSSPSLSSSGGSRNPVSGMRKMFSRLLVGSSGGTASAAPSWVGEQARCKFFFGRTYINTALWSRYGSRQSKSSKPRRVCERVLPELRAHKQWFWRDAPLRELISSSLGEMSDRQLCDAFHELVSFQHSVDTQSYLVGEAVETLESQLTSFCKRHTRQLSPGLDLGCAVAGVNCDSAAKQSFERLQVMADQVMADPATRALFHFDDDSDSDSDDDEVDESNVAEEDIRCSIDYLRDHVRPFPAGEQLAAQFDQYLERYFYMSDQDEDISKPRFKEAPQMAWSILANLIIGKMKQNMSSHSSAVASVARVSASVDSDSSLGKSDGSSSASSSASSSSLTEERSSPSTRSRKLASLPFLQAKRSSSKDLDEDSFPQLVVSKDVPAYVVEMARVRELLSGSAYKSLECLVSSLREMLHWKEDIHVIYTQNLYFLRRVIVEGMLRTDLAHVGGLEWIGDGEKGTLSENHPVWFIDFVELGQMFQTPLKRVSMSVERCQEVLTLFTKAKCMRDMYRGFTPPPHIGRGRRVKVGATGQEVWDSHSTKASAVLKGLGCSAGQVQGTVRVIQSLAESSQVKAGDILVTRYTNPSWTPLFSLVVAVVLEDGGMLSHAAVVARECGIACVVQVPGACTQLRSGSKAVVDGTAGTISIV